MSKVKEELQELQREIGIHDALIHDIYSSLIRRLNREIDNSALAAKDTDSITELSKKCRFLEIEAKGYREHKSWEEEEIKYKKENFGNMAAYLQYNADRLKNATVIEVRDRNMYGEIVSLVVEKEGKRYILEAEARKDDVDVCRPWIAVEELEWIKKKQ